MNIIVSEVEGAHRYLQCLIKPVLPLAGLVKALQSVNGTTWHDTFLGLWISALRLVQRVCMFLDTSFSKLCTNLRHSRSVS